MALAGGAECEPAAPDNGCTGGLPPVGASGVCGLPFVDGSGCPPGEPGNGDVAALRSSEAGTCWPDGVGSWPGCLIVGCGPGIRGLVCCAGVGGLCCGMVIAAFFATVFGNDGASKAAPATAAPAAAIPTAAPCEGAAATLGIFGVACSPGGGAAGEVAVGFVAAGCGASACTGVTVCAWPPGLVIVTMLVVLLITTVL